MSDASVWARESTCFSSSLVLSPSSTSIVFLLAVSVQVYVVVFKLITLDPTLDRLSSPEEVAAVRRRAAPKLFRTRRLANGQVIRSRAGPAVEAKFRQVRESIAETRRHRGSVSVTDDQASPLPDTDDYEHEAGVSIATPPREH